MALTYLTTKKIPIVCRFEGTILGEWEVPLTLWADGEKRLTKWGMMQKITYANLGIVDTRCDSCNIEHGRYAELEEKAREKGLSNEEFQEVMVKANFAKKTFDKYLDDKVKEKNAIITP